MTGGPKHESGSGWSIVAPIMNGGLSKYCTVMLSTTQLADEQGPHVAIGLFCSSLLS